MTIPATLCLRNHFLVAMPQLKDPNFESSLVYLCEHSDEGAMGIVVNRPTGLALSEMLEQLGLDIPKGAQSVYTGGPIQVERGFVLHNGGDRWQATLEVAPGIQVTTSRDILEDLSRGDGPEDCLVALGYAGWSAGQLEQELVDNAWLTCPADADTLFKVPDEDKAATALAKIGVDLNQLASFSGHG